MSKASPEHKTQNGPEESRHVWLNELNYLRDKIHVGWQNVAYTALVFVFVAYVLWLVFA